MRAMEDAIKPFEKYIDDLAKGEWDWYFGSIDKRENLNMEMPSGPLLLLHGLGTALRPEDQKRIEILFRPGITFVIVNCTRMFSNLVSRSHLFAVSGSGKTRLSLEGLGKHWGIYFSCSAQVGKPTGSNDLSCATDALTTMTASSTTTEMNSNVDAARRAFTQLLCARVFILKSLLQNIPPGTTVR